MIDRTHDGSLTGSEMVLSWKALTKSWDEVSKIVNLVTADNHDEWLNCSKLELFADDGHLKLGIDGTGYLFSKGSFDQLSMHLGGLGTRLAEQGMDEKETGWINDLYCHRWKGFVRENPNKQMFLRLRSGQGDFELEGSCRAVLTGRYKPLNHSWIIDQMASERPEGLLRFDERAFRDCGGDTLKVDIIDEGSMRALVDGGGGYGGGELVDDICGNMVSVVNNEVGRGRFSVLGSIYRCICANGSIMNVGREEKLINMVHNGRLDKDQILKDIVLQLSAIETRFDKGMNELEILKNERSLPDGLVEEQLLMFCGKSKTLQNTKREQIELYSALCVESDNMRNGAYSVYNAITRWAHEENNDPADQQIIELAAGQFSARWQDESKFALDCRNASSVDVSKECMFLGS